ncbi:MULTISPECIES: ABC transporter permease [Halocynthiibacter]|uniref:ABC transporter permease n=1 Tax=Halocynthiibacter halioticoli TaxID=2986804 RepID=A0AAE3LP60_9RHOB|nr:MULTISPECIES: ABC transporter permease [Halocynthiibacter]MCV6822987.1 ABC transporter permease [Halocynthiibacter halioticoli]MCW4055988.1 ABC transporter permease [Halocynthiibacter sp. SDUM655004]MDE0591442.1 ABC transporter permease [Halocynthiibacter sp. C4]
MSITENATLQIASPKSSALKRFTNFVGAENLSLIIALIIMVALIATQTEFFFSARNLMNIGQNMAVVGLIAVGMTLVIVSAGLDISVGSIAGCASVVCALTVTQMGTVTGGVFAGMGIGIILGLINATIISILRVNPVVATLATFSAFRGVAFLIAPDGRPVGVLDPNLAWLGSGRLFQTESFPGLPVAFLLLVLVAVVAHFVMTSTVFGRSIYSMGGNPVAARLAGINLTRMRYAIYAVSGALSGLAGVLVTARTSSGQPASGTQGLELEAITAVFLGGALMAGGKGTIVGSMLAVLLLATLSNGMNLLGIPTFYQLVAKGLLLVLAVAIGQWRLARSEKQQAKLAAAGK